jgi:hypothetical protein
MNQNWSHEETKSRLNSRNACYSAVQHYLSSNLLSNNIKMLFCTDMKHGLSHREKNTDWQCLRTGCLKEYLDPRGMKWWKTGGGQLHNEKLNISYSSPVRVIKSRRMTWMEHISHIGRWEVHTKFIIFGIYVGVRAPCIGFPASCCITSLYSTWFKFLCQCLGDRLRDTWHQCNTRHASTVSHLCFVQNLVSLLAYRNCDVMSRFASVLSYSILRLLFSWSGITCQHQDNRRALHVKSIPLLKQCLLPLIMDHEFIDYHSKI